MKPREAIPHQNSDLQIDNSLGSITALSTKRSLSAQIMRAMRQKKITKAELARRMRTSRAVIHRLLDENDSSVTLATISKAAAALGRGVRLKLSA